MGLKLRKSKPGVVYWPSDSAPDKVAFTLRAVTFQERADLLDAFDSSGGVKYGTFQMKALTRCVAGWDDPLIEFSPANLMNLEKEVHDFLFEKIQERNLLGFDTTVSGQAEKTKVVSDLPN